MSAEAQNPPEKCPFDKKHSRPRTTTKFENCKKTAERRPEKRKINVSTAQQEYSKGKKGVSKGNESKQEEKAGRLFQRSAQSQKPPENFVQNFGNTRSLNHEIRREMKEVVKLL